MMLRWKFGVTEVKKERKHPVLRFCVRLAATLLILILVAGATLFLVGYHEYKKVIAEKPIRPTMEALYEKEHYTTLDELPQTYLDAVLAVEDHRFFQHGAISLISTARAVAVNIKTGAFTEGGSTITQQVAKNRFFTQEKTVRRKLAEMVMAIRLEQLYSKEEILEFYVNDIYFGSGYYCIYDASVGYYGVSPQDLSDYQATLLAGLPNAPSVYSPDNQSELTDQRHRQVLESMVKYRYLSKEQADRILEQSNE